MKKSKLPALRTPFAGLSWQGAYGNSWKTFGRDLWKEISEDNVFNGAAALGYYLTLAIFPALIFILGLLPYLHIDGLHNSANGLIGRFLPQDSAQMLNETLAGILQKKHDGLLSIGAVLTIWAASSGLYGLMQQLNITYDVVEGRPFWKARLTALLLVIAFAVLTISALALTVVGDNLHNWLSQQTFWNGAFAAGYEIARWLVAGLSLSLAFATVYYFGPDVEQRFAFVTPGSLISVAVLLAASFGFKLYVEHFGNYNATYGSIGAVIVLMLWLNLLGLVTLIGSEVNALLEHYSPEGKNKGEKEEPAAA